jgi:hypothetical protein
MYIHPLMVGATYNEGEWGVNQSAKLTLWLSVRRTAVVGLEQTGMYWLELWTKYLRCNTGMDRGELWRASRSVGGAIFISRLECGLG